MSLDDALALAGQVLADYETTVFAAAQDVHDGDAQRGDAGV